MELRFNDGSLARIGEGGHFKFGPNRRTFSNDPGIEWFGPGQSRNPISPNAVVGIRG